MKITSKILHYPPYISTSWVFIQALYLKGEHLVICLKDGSLIEIPELSPDTLEIIFNAHAHFLASDRNPPELPPSPSSKMTGPTNIQETTSPFPFLQNAEHFPFGSTPPAEAGAEPSVRMDFGSIESFGAAMHHNSAQANMPDLPIEILTKIAAVAKIVAPDEVQTMPKPEPHCNCTYCQIARAVHHGVSAAKELSAIDSPVVNEGEEEVSDSELTFQQWEITQTGERLYAVVNRLDSHEKYSVYLGHPVGCTCGKQGCEHILAVLKS